MAQVSIVTAARAAESSKQQAVDEAMVVLNPSAREFLPWWRLGCAAKKALSVDAPEFVMSAAGRSPAPALSVDAPEFVMAGAGIADAGGDSNVTSPGKVRKARVRTRSS